MNTFRPGPLNWIGFFLGLSHLVSLYHFQFSSGRSALGRLFDGQTPLCYPLFSSCEALRPWLQENHLALLWLYFAAAAISSAVFLCKPAASIWKWVLLLPLAIKSFIQFQDQTLGGNFHLIGYFVHAAFLLARDPLRAIKATLWATYLGAGLLKLDPEWLSGHLLLSLSGEYPGAMTPLLENQTLLMAAVFAPMAFELIVSWGLLLGGKPYLLAMASAAMFHLTSIFFVGPLFAYFMICYLPALWFGRHSPIFSQSFIWRRDLRGWAIPALLLALQVPHVLGGPERTFSSPWRFYSLNMLDSHPTCSFFAFARFDDRSHDIGFGRARLGPRSRCDLHVYRAITDHYCRELSDQAGFRGIRWALHGRRSHDPRSIRVHEALNACAPQEVR